MTCGCQQVPTSLGCGPGGPLGMRMGALRTVRANQPNLSGQLPLMTVRQRNLGALGAVDMEQIGATIAQLEADQSSLENDLDVLIASGGDASLFQSLVTTSSDALVGLEADSKSLGDQSMPGWLARAAQLRSSIAVLRQQIASSQRRVGSGGLVRAVLIGASAVAAAAIVVGTLALKGPARHQRSYA